MTEAELKRLTNEQLIKLHEKCLTYYEDTLHAGEPREAFERCQLIQRELQQRQAKGPRCANCLSPVGPSGGCTSMHCDGVIVYGTVEERP